MLAILADSHDITTAIHHDTARETVTWGCRIARETPETDYEIIYKRSSDHLVLYCRRVGRSGVANCGQSTGEIEDYTVRVQYYVLSCAIFANIYDLGKYSHSLRISNTRAYGLV